MKINDPWLLQPQIVERGAYIDVWMAHTMIVRKKNLTSKTNNKISYTTILCNIPSNINKQTNNYIMQDHAKQGYIFGHLSLIRNLALDISSGVTTMRDLKSCLSKKRDFWSAF